MIKTNVMRLLEKAGIDYMSVSYEYDENNLSGLLAAEKIGVNPNMVFKTLVAKGDKTGVLVFCIPVNKELDLKKAALVSKNKKVDMVNMKDILGLTGYIRGGCSPIGMKKKYSTFIDISSLLLERIAISAGVRGEQVLLNPKDLIEYLSIEVVSLVKD